MLDDPSRTQEGVPCQGFCLPTQAKSRTSVWGPPESEINCDESPCGAAGTVRAAARRLDEHRCISARITASCFALPWIVFQSRAHAVCSFAVHQLLQHEQHMCVLGLLSRLGSFPKFGAPIYTPIYYSPYHWDPQKGSPHFGKPTLLCGSTTLQLLTTLQL